MRLLDLKRHISNAYENFNPEYSNSNGNYYIHNVVSLKKAIQSLYDAGIITRDGLEVNIFTIIDSCMTDQLIFSSSQIDGYKVEIEKLRSTIGILYNWINRYIPETEDDTTINIKLPPLGEFEDLVKASNIINKALSWSIAEIGGEVRVKHLDYGSSWIIISTGTALAAKLAMLLANAAFTIAQKYYGIKMLRQQYERCRMGTEIMRTIKDVNEKIIAADVRALAEQIEKKTYTDTNNERIERLRVSITEMCKLIELGGEIHPALIGNSDNSIVAPDYKSLLNVIKSTGELPRSEDIKSEEE